MGLKQVVPAALGVGATALSGGTLAPLFGSSLLSQGLLGAGVGALGGALTGQDPLKSALLGGAGGALSGAMGLGGASSGVGGATVSKVPSSIGVNIAPELLKETGDISFSLVPKALDSATTGAIKLGQGATDSVLGFNPVSAASGAGSIDNLAQYATGAGTDLMAASPSLIDKLKPYANVQNLSGAMNVAEKFQPKKPTFISAPSGGVSRGQAPQSGGLILSMDDLMKLSQLQRSNPISLLVG